MIHIQVTVVITALNCNVLQLPQGQSQTYPEEERPCLSEILTVKSALLLFILFVLQFVAD